MGWYRESILYVISARERGNVVAVFHWRKEDDRGGEGRGWVGVEKASNSLGAKL